MALLHRVKEGQEVGTGEISTEGMSEDESKVENNREG